MFVVVHLVLWVLVGCQRRLWVAAVVHFLLRWLDSACWFWLGLQAACASPARGTVWATSLLASRGVAVGLGGGVSHALTGI